MTITVECPACHVRLKAPDKAQGKQLHCPKCGGAITVPDESVTAAASAPSIPASDAPVRAAASPIARITAILVSAARSINWRKHRIPLVIGVAGLVLGYFLGREHIKYEIRSAFDDAKDAFSSILDRPAPLAKDDEKKSAPTPETVVYTSSVEIYDIVADRTSANSFTDPLKPFIKGKIKNNGQKTLKSVSVRFYFQNTKGQVVFESTDKTHFGSGFNDTPLLRPGYIAEFTHIAEECPSEALARPSKIEVVDIEFAD